MASAEIFFEEFAMSALLPKADMSDATRDVRFGPKADIVLLIRQSRRHVAAEAMARPTQALSPS